MRLNKIDLEKSRRNRLESHVIRKNISFTILVIIIVTLFLVYLILHINPDNFWAKPVFFILVFIDFFYIFSILFVKKRRGLLAAGVVTSFLIFKLFGIETSYYYLAPIVTAMIIEVLFVVRKR